MALTHTGSSLAARVRALPAALRWLMLLGGAVLTGCTLLFPKVGVLEWVSLIPSALVILTVVTDPTIRLRRLYLYGFAFFEVYCMTFFHWFLYMYPLDFAGLSDGASLVVVLVAWIGLSTLQAVGAALLLPLLALAVRGKFLSAHPLFHPFLLAAMWTVLEWWQAHSGWSGVPWGRLPIGQTELRVTALSSAWFGSYFVTFMILIVNGLLAYLILHPDRRRLCAVLAGSLCAGNLALGCLRLATYRDEGEAVTVAAAQGNMSSLDKWGTDAMQNARHIYGELTREAVADGAVLVVWPETALPVRVDESTLTSEFLRELALETRATLLVGTFTGDPNGAAEGEYNSVVAIRPDGCMDDTVYNKRNPVPFGEFVPYRDLVMTLVPPLAEVGMLDSDLLVGKASVVFDLEVGRIGAMVCFDSIYERNARESVNNGAQLLVVSTNDSWFRDSRGIWMHNAQSKLRAMETGRYVVRAGNTGVSGIITPLGGVQEELGPLRKGVVTGQVYLNEARTLYCIVGDVAAHLCVAFCAGCLLLRPAEIFYDRRKKEPKETP